MPASSHYKAKGRPTVRKAVTALKRAIARRGRGVTTMPYLGCGSVTTMPYLGSGRRGKRRGGISWNMIENAWRSIPSALGSLPPSPMGISNAGVEQLLRSSGLFG